ncbi:glycosyltransferase family 4 protein [Bradyrhizobium sp. McL0615]|uniref:glycosyltransferase family 4 protein n=1 Tax=Bradyrhizobium sp. McL0615 TaxID=3415673 RepID=UPI003CF47ED5
MSGRVVLTVSGIIAAGLHEQIASGRRPRADYLELAQRFNADLLDYAAARTIAGRVGSVLARLGGPNLVVAYACWKIRKSCQAIVTDGEQVGLPLAALLKFTPGKRPRHMMIVHVISETKKTVFLDVLRVQNAIDRFITYSRWQQRFIEERWKIDRSRVLWTPFMVDQEFFAPERVAPSLSARRQICAVGLERRDYETLLRAVEDIDVHVVIAAASPWAKHAKGVATANIPNNVTVRKFTQFDLRQLYADSRFLVMPLENVKFQAGVTAILEGMAMGKAVICSRVPGQTDVVVDGENGRYVPPGDPAILRTEILRLLSDVEEAARLGANGRKLIEREMNLDLYAQRLTGYLGDVVNAEKRH